MKRLIFTLTIILSSLQLLLAQDNVLTGVVNDGGANSTLPGVSVLIKGTTKGAITDFDGKFSIPKPNQGDVIVFTYVGMKSQEITYNGQKDIDITLQPDVKELDDIVIVAYGAQKKTSVTGAVAKLDSEELVDVTTPNVSGMLQSKAAGVQVASTSGQPGATTEIRIRGKASMNASIDPLWVVDGVIMHGVPEINPADIENISILKDASATSLYGSRGANGVVMVTTKRAKDGTSQFNFSAKSGITQLNQGNFELMDGQEMVNYYKKFPNQGDIPAMITDNYSQLAKQNYDWVDNGTQNGIAQDYNLSYTGGTDKIRTFISGGYYNESGAVQGFDYERYTTRMNLDYSVNDKLTFKPKIALTYKETEDRQHDLYEMYRNMPWDNPYGADGKPVNPRDPNVVWYGRDMNNYLYDLQWNYGETSSLDMIANFDIEYDISKHFKFVSTNSITTMNGNTYYYTDPQSIAGEAMIGNINQSKSNGVNRFTNQMLRYFNTFGKHDINALVAYEYNDYAFNNISAQGNGIIPGTKILDGTAIPQTVQGTKYDYALQSFLFNANYSYDEKYMAQFSFRTDGASNVGINNRYGSFFSISGGWNINNEDFINSNNITMFKLRGSYGSLGNRPESMYPYQNLYYLDYSYNGIPAAIPGQYPNYDLSWEKSYQGNIAIDFGLWDKLNFTVEYYNINTSDLLYYVKLPSVSGFDGYWENVGGVTNKGFEFFMSYDAVQRKDFSLGFDFNIGINRNQVTEVYEDQDVIRGNKITKVGSDIDTWYLRKWAGVDPQTGNPTWERVDPETGEVTITDDYAQATLQEVGTSTPNFQGGVTLRAEYKGIFLNANFAYSHGAMIYNMARETYDSDGAYASYNQMKLQDGWSRWEKPGDVATHPRMEYNNQSQSNKPSSRYLEDGSYLRLRNLSFGYRLPNKLTEKMNIKNARIYFSGDNLWTLTGYSGMDPEVGDGSDMSAFYPVPKRFMFGLNFSF
ncbi:MULTISPECIES: SusC/RagA family TonB-linked outer membrane protein [Flammeovirga]|uniref:TonB-dependent receptor n=1 Tax=Flammeovirga agarivorans TaxID=2726742 RepID=A0A7X8SK39_9BACT|nr:MULTISPECIES: TonB-dependent receptor [Flammeovirga]NLR91691.1 TonB-dependent receptor [Flammeovirga agarivorans]